MKQIKQNNNLLGGKVINFWTQIEFQNRGSPHIHTVVWIENAPSVKISKGFINQMILYCLPSKEDPDLSALVKCKQVHHHIHTCHKNNSETCRIAFPRESFQ